MSSPTLREIGVTFPSAIDPGGDVTRQWRATGLPTTFLIDREGSSATSGSAPSPTRCWTSAWRSSSTSRRWAEASRQNKGERGTNGRASGAPLLGREDRHRVGVSRWLTRQPHRGLTRWACLARHCCLLVCWPASSSSALSLRRRGGLLRLRPSRLWRPPGSDRRWRGRAGERSSGTSRISRSARLPGSSEPTSSPRPLAKAALTVVATSASAGVRLSCQAGGSQDVERGRASIA